MRYQNHGIYIGQHHTLVQHLWQKNRSQTSNNTPRSGKIEMEKGRPYLTSVWCLSVNGIWNASDTRLRTPEYQESVVNINVTGISQHKTGCTRRTYHGIISNLIRDKKYNSDRTLGPAQNTKHINTRISSPLQHSSIYCIRNFQMLATPALGRLEAYSHHRMELTWPQIVKTITVDDYCPHGTLHHEMNE